MLISVDDPTAGSLRLAGNPIKLSGFPDEATRPSAPDVDQDRDKILKQLAG